MMYLITKELQEQLVSETTKPKSDSGRKKKKKNSKKEDEAKPKKVRKPWLVNFLKNHGFWIRRETFPVWSQHFDFTDIVFNKHYLRDIRIWIPELEGGLSCRPCCPNCQSNDAVKLNCHPQDHPARRIITFNNHYYLMARQYKCLQCKEANTLAKKEKPASKVQWTFMSSDIEVVSLLPFFMKVQFPCVLSHRSGLDLQLARIFRPLVDKGSTFETISGMLRELHSLTYFDEMIQHQSEK